MARRNDDPRDVYLVLHGHFYQPPRENPWLEAVEREPSAAPGENWNARIADECYRVNGWARVFDDAGHVVDIVNNYTHLSFNFGPTLLSWLEEKEPATYARLLEADRVSAALRSGHGNALGQAYGHAILPLSNDRDRRTQIRWGARDFERRFGRRAEALWMPETAVDAATIEDLIEEGLVFLILAPSQAKRIRRLQGAEEEPGAWTDVSGGKVDPRTPYRCFSRAGRDRHIDIFFYDGPVSHAISFERVLYSSRQLVDKLWGAVDGQRQGPQLVHSAVDGETFGHHLRHAERALAFAFTVEAPRRGLRLTNYAEFLSLCPPTSEVELEFSESGEGTSWSCAHGVGRWCRDCGCHTGAPAGWNQAWRAPLRAAVNLVRDEAAAVFEEMGGELLRDVWAARDDYIELLLDRSPERRERFLEEHGRGGSNVSRQVRALKLLEMQRMSLLSQTSCGWFFNDISGLEAVQVLKYAACAVQIVEEVSGRSLEPDLLEVLAEARSNLPSQGTGADIYRRLVLPSVIDARRFVAQVAITDVLRRYPEEHTRFGHHVRKVEERTLESGHVRMTVGRLQLEVLRTGECKDFTYALIHFGGHDFHCAVRPFSGIQEFRAFLARIEAIFEQATITEILRAVDAHFGETYFGLAHLLPEEREDVLEALFADLTGRFAETYVRLYRDHRQAIGALIDAGLKVPREYRMAAEYTLSRELNEEILAQRGSHDPGRYERAREIVEESKLRGFHLDLSESDALFGEMLLDSARTLLASPSEDAALGVLDLVALAESLALTLPHGPAQDLVFEALASGALRADLLALGETGAELLDKLRLSARLLEEPPEKTAPAG
jgi:alpha-amylase/alpha-mannosidase (GH57 family)